eukprot:SAG11_NODE_31_length_23119_cov_102.800608_12_plen_85_part_00
MNSMGKHIYFSETNDKKSVNSAETNLGPRLRAKGFLAACGSDTRKVNAVRGDRVGPDVLREHLVARLCHKFDFWHSLAHHLADE